METNCRGNHALRVMVAHFVGGHHALGVTAPAIFFFRSGLSGLGSE